MNPSHTSAGPVHAGDQSWGVTLPYQNSTDGSCALSTWYHALLSRGNKLSYTVLRPCTRSILPMPRGLCSEKHCPFAQVGKMKYKEGRRPSVCNQLEGEERPPQPQQRWQSEALPPISGVQIKQQPKEEAAVKRVLYLQGQRPTKRSLAPAGCCRWPPASPAKELGLECATSQVGLMEPVQCEGLVSGYDPPFSYFLHLLLGCVCTERSRADRWKN